MKKFPVVVFVLFFLGFYVFSLDIGRGSWYVGAVSQHYSIKDLEDGILYTPACGIGNWLYIPLSNLNEKDGSIYGMSVGIKQWVDWFCLYGDASFSPGLGQHSIFMANVGISACLVNTKVFHFGVGFKAGLYYAKSDSWRVGDLILPGTQWVEPSYYDYLNGGVKKTYSLSYSTEGFVTTPFVDLSFDFSKESSLGLYVGYQYGVMTGDCISCHGEIPMNFLSSADYKDLSMNQSFSPSGIIATIYYQHYVYTDDSK